MPLSVCVSPSSVPPDALLQVGSGCNNESDLVSGDPSIMTSDNFETNSPLKSSPNEETNLSLGISEEAKGPRVEGKGQLGTQDLAYQKKNSVDGIKSESYEPFCQAQTHSPLNTMFGFTGQHGTPHPNLSLASPGTYMTHHPMISGAYNGFLSSPRHGYPSPGYSYGQQYGHGYHNGSLYPFTSGTAAASIFSGQAQVYLCNRALWLRFHRYQTEMIITKQGRRMFPFLSFNITGLNPSGKYKVFVDVILADPNHWRFQGGKWVPCGKADTNITANRIHLHADSPNTGAHWMRQEISFGKLKLTNSKGGSSPGQMVVLQSLHKYQPRLHVVEVTEDGTEIDQQDKVQTFTFVETQFIAVTAYQNTDITQLKIDHNPFAKGFRDNYDTVYSGLDIGRLTPSPVESSRALMPGSRYAMANSFFSDQFGAYPKVPFSSGTGPGFGVDIEMVPLNNPIGSQQHPDNELTGPAHRWFTAPSGNRLDLPTAVYDATAVDLAGNAATLLSYTAGVKALTLANTGGSSRTIGYYNEFNAWPPRSPLPYPEKSPPVPSCWTALSSENYIDKSVYLGETESADAPLESSAQLNEDPKHKDSSWIETSANLLDSAEHGIYDQSKRMRISRPSPDSRDLSPIKTDSDAAQDSKGPDAVDIHNNTFLYSQS